MTSSRPFRALGLGIVLPSLVLVAALTTTAKSQAGDASPIGQIDTECNAIQNAVMALHPIHVAYQSGAWVVLSDADFAVAEKVGASIMLADVYKQGSNYAWVAAHSFDASGKQRATQLCFRQSDGTLERARQETTLSPFQQTSDCCPSTVDERFRNEKSVNHGIACGGFSRGMRAAPAC